MVAYVAGSYQADGNTGEKLRQRTYSDIRANVDPASYEDLTAGAYRSSVARDPVSLEQQVPFYSIRVAYIAAVRALGRLTGSYTSATHLVAAMFGSLSVAVMGFMLLRNRIPAVILPLIVSPLGIVELSRIATPDSMACFVSLLLILSLFRTGWPAYLLIALMPLIRSDYLILSGLGAAYIFYTHDRRRAGLALFSAIAGYFIVGQVSGNYGYITLLNFTFFEQNPYPANMPISGDLGAYAAAAIRSTNFFISDPVFLLYVFSAAILWRYRGQVRTSKDLLLYTLLPVLFSAAHFGFFPSYDTRFLVSSFFLMVVGIVKAAAGCENRPDDRRSLALRSARACDP